ncbi:MAG TPA: hypothetical protein VFG14_06085, partial [Chthoniobacteraceae bacterium]|nr:hypothetical protein [Chthoniobacteraceae bacterium]
GQMLKVKATGDPANSDLDFQTFSAPTQTAAGQGSYLATLTPEFDSPPNDPVHGVFAANDPDSINAFPVAFSGDPLPDRPEASFRRFINLVTSSVSPFAFTCQISGPGIDRSNDTEIWWSGFGGISLLFQEGSAAPGVEGAKFREFLSLAMPENARPLLKARVSRGGNRFGRGPARTADGLWYLDRGNAARLYLLQGDPLPEANNRPVRKIHILENVPGSPTQTRSHNKQGQITFRADFNDGSQAIIRASLP